jgi:hypothetical protein
MPRWSLVALVVSMSACGPTDEEPQVPEVNQFSQRFEPLTTCAPVVTSSAELLVSGLAVVEDPVRTVWTGGLTGADGAWHFGRLMTAMAGPQDPATFVKNWLNQWATPRTVNGFTVPARTQLVTQVLNPWLAASGGTSLDLKKAPFRLLAIVYRPDLKNLARGSAGEGRFVFGVLGPTGASLQFTVILEYRLPAVTEADAKDWAEQWHALSNKTVGSAAYNLALQKITARFAGPNVEVGRVNGSAINQVRSNEIALASPWELREFRLNTAGSLVQSTVAQTPDLALNGSTTLRDFINTNSAALLTDSHVVPLTFNDVKFRGGSSPVSSTWNANGISNPEARFHFAVNTCSGCHRAETGTLFLHVAPREKGSVAQLSGFLSGTSVGDPISGKLRTFNDLANRATVVKALLCSTPPQPICGLFRGGNDTATNMIASPNPEGSYGTTTADCIAYCQASGPQPLDTCQYGTTWASRVIVKTF